MDINEEYGEVDPSMMKYVSEHQTENEKMSWLPEREVVLEALKKIDIHITPPTVFFSAATLEESIGKFEVSFREDLIKQYSTAIIEGEAYIFVSPEGARRNPFELKLTATGFEGDPDLIAMFTVSSSLDGNDNMLYTAAEDSTNTVANGLDVISSGSLPIKVIRNTSPLGEE